MPKFATPDAFNLFTILHKIFIRPYNFSKWDNSSPKDSILNREGKVSFGARLIGATLKYLHLIETYSWNKLLILLISSGSAENRYPLRSYKHFFLTPLHQGHRVPKFYDVLSLQISSYRSFRSKLEHSENNTIHYSFSTLCLCFSSQIIDSKGSQWSAYMR